MKRVRKLFLVIIITAFALQAGLTVFAEVSETTQSSQTNQYRQFLHDFKVAGSLQEQLDSYISDGYPLHDILIGYEYVYHHFGTIDQLSSLLEKRHQGEDWAALFTNYQAESTAFVPRAFEPEYLEKLSKTPGFTSDDIMIADMVSFVSGKPVDDIVLMRQEEAQSWQQITAGEGILYSADILPRVPVTSEQLQKYRASTGLTEDEIANALVIAHKLGASADKVVSSFAAGLTEHQIFADLLSEKYKG